MSRLAIFLLGPPHIERGPLRGEGEPVHIGRKKALALLAYLAVTPGSQRRDALATLLWPDYDQRTARAHLRRALVSLTNRLGDEWFAADRETIGLITREELWLDVDQFRQRLAACEAHSHAATDTCPDCLALLTEATELYSDDFMAGFSLPDSLPFDEWQRHQTERLRDDLGRVLERLSACHAALGEYKPALAAAQRWLELDPLREAAHRYLMELYAQAGRNGAALRQYRACVRVLEQDLGVPPSAETTALYQRLRAERLRPNEKVTHPAPPPEPTPRLPAFLDPDAEPATVPEEVFVARERQLAVLSAHLDAAVSGQARVVFVTGGPGRGKSSLVNQFARQALAAHPELLAAKGSCNAYSGAGDPYLPFRELLSTLTGDVETSWAAGAISRDHARRLWATIPLASQALLDHGPYLINTLLPGPPLLLRATAAADGSPAWLGELSVWAQHERPGQSDLPQSAIFEQFTNVLRTLAADHPLLLTLDDLQWADSGSINLLFHLGRRLADAGGRILIVGAYRPEEVSAGRNGPRHPLVPVLDELQRRFGDVWVDLAQADETHGRRFVDAYLNTEPNRLGEGFRSALFQHTGGHPLFTVELLHAMQARGDLARDVSKGGAWVEGPALDWGTLPARAEAVIKARVGRLDEEQRDTLTVASVEGARFTAQVIANVLDVPERQMLRARSQELGPQGHRLVREAGEEPVAGRFLSRYQFAHALFQAHLYNTLSPGERRLLHGEIAAALETLYGAQTDEIAVPLAHHYDSAGKVEKAIEYALRAGDLAYQAYANEQAVAYFQRVLDLLDAAPPGDERGNWRLAALTGMGKTQFRAGPTEAADLHLREAITLGRELGTEPRDLVQLYNLLAELQWWQGRSDEQLRLGEEGLALLGVDAAAGEAVASVEAALMYDNIGVAYVQMGNPDKYREFLQRTSGLIRAVPYTEELRAPFVHLADLYAFEKDLVGAMSWVNALEQRATPRRDLRALGSVQYYTAWFLDLQGDIPGAISHFQQALEYLTKIGDVKEKTYCVGNMCGAFLRLGDLQTAAEYSHKLLEHAEAVGAVYPQAIGHLHLGLVCLARSAWKEAEDALQSAIRIYSDIGTPWEQATAACALGQVFLAQNNRSDALERIQDAIAVGGPEVFRPDRLPPALPHLLSGLEEAYQDPAAFRAFCLRLREEHPDGDWGLANWFLEPAEPFDLSRCLIHDPFVGSRSPDCAKSSAWDWQDPLGDCSFNAQDGLQVYAANGSDLWHLNLSAPRLLRQAPQEGDLATQTVCGRALHDRPAIGGLLLWKSQENYLRLDWGISGVHEIGFQGCLDNQDVIIGRGHLSQDASGRVFLRLECVDRHVRALCSADGQEWFTVGEVEFPIEGDVQVGLHAIGFIHPGIYRGAHPDGTAIRFESFALWGL